MYYFDTALFAVYTFVTVITVIFTISNRWVFTAFTDFGFLEYLALVLALLSVPIFFGTYYIGVRINLHTDVIGSLACAATMYVCCGYMSAFYTIVYVATWRKRYDTKHQYPINVFVWPFTLSPVTKSFFTWWRGGWA